MRQERNWVTIGDLHLTDQARDDYRFGIFDWIRRQQEKLSPAATFLAGDITDAKDRHSATLVNKIVAGLTKLKPPVYICRGNHDYRDPANPFFNFLNHINGLTFVTEPMVAHGMAIIPHVRTQDEFDAAVNSVGAADAFLVHQTFDGAIAETGVRLTGLSVAPIELLRPALGVYAGDVHRPQRQGIVTYVGCPYHVRFGDDYTPRSLWTNGIVTINKYFDAPYKWSLTVRDPVDIANSDRLAKGDQVKLTIEVAREEMVEWKKIKADVLAACKDRRLEVYGVTLQVNNTAVKQREPIRMGQTNAEILGSFCDAERLSTATREAGKRLFGETRHGD